MIAKYPSPALVQERGMEDPKAEEEFALVTESVRIIRNAQMGAGNPKVLKIQALAEGGMAEYALFLSSNERRALFLTLIAETVVSVLCLWTLRHLPALSVLI